MKTRWSRFGLSSDSTRSLVASPAEEGEDSVRMTTKAPLCIGTMRRDLPSCAAVRFAGAGPSANARAGAASRRSSSATADSLLLIGATSAHDAELHLARGLEVVHVHARVVAGVRLGTLRGLG